MRLHLLFFLLFFSNYYLSAQIVYRDAGQKTDTIELRNMYSKALSVLDSTKKKGFQIDRMDIVEINETKYLIPNGMFDVYRWTNGQWDNMYKGPFQGFNFGAKIFVHKDEIYAFGGYGYWRNHGLIVRFLRDRGEWDVLPFTSELPFYYGYQNAKGLHVFNNIKSMDLNIDDMSVVESEDIMVKNIVMPKPTHLNSIELENYYYLIEQLPYLIDKRNGEVRTTIDIPFRGYANSAGNLLHIYSDLIDFYSNNLNNHYTFDPSAEIQSLKLADTTQAGQIPLWISISGGFLLIGLVSYTYIRYKKKGTKIVDTEDITWDNKYIDSLLTHSGSTLNMEEIDAIFGITELIPQESQRFKRHALIKDINRIYRYRLNKDLIIRRKDTGDGRRYVYEIGNE